MPVAALTFNEDHALSRLLRFLAVEGVTGQERAIGEAVMRDLVESGVPRPAIVFDQAHERIELLVRREYREVACFEGNILYAQSGDSAACGLH